MFISAVNINLADPMTIGKYCLEFQYLTLWSISEICIMHTIASSKAQRWSSEISDRASHSFNCDISIIDQYFMI